MKQTAKAFATAGQKDNFRAKFAAIVINNPLLQNYTIRFFDTLANSNYVIQGPNGNSINVNECLTVTELEHYRLLKSGWRA